MLIISRVEKQILAFPNKGVLYNNQNKLQLQSMDASPKCCFAENTPDRKEQVLYETTDVSPKIKKLICIFRSQSRGNLCMEIRSGYWVTKCSSVIFIIFFFFLDLSASYTEVCLLCINTHGLMYFSICTWHFNKNIC